MSIIIGLTGPTGSGKSSLAPVAESYGFKVVNCDLLARQATVKGSAGLKALTAVFGEEILNTDGSLNRKGLAAIAFSSSQKTELLNKTIFPYITELLMKEITGERVLLDAPTLFESGIDSICTATIAVLADKEIRLNRILVRDNISHEAALLRISAGKPDEFYKERSDYIIYNNGDSKVFNKQFAGILNDILKEK